MPDLYPLHLRPEFHERVWGRSNLAPFYGRAMAGQPIGEAWLTGDACIVSNGPLAGRTLSELTREYGARLVGEAATDPARFPLLIKFLFLQDRLSVQVHPDDETAALRGEPCRTTAACNLRHSHPAP